MTSTARLFQRPRRQCGHALASPWSVTVVMLSVVVSSSLPSSLAFATTSSLFSSFLSSRCGFSAIDYVKYRMHQSRHRKHSFVFSSGNTNGVILEAGKSSGGHSDVHRCHLEALRHTSPLSADDNDDEEEDGVDEEKTRRRPTLTDDDVIADALYMERFRRRREEVLLTTARKRYARPPNPFLDDPNEFVEAILTALLRPPDEHDPFSGATTLLRSSTPTWRDVLRRSVGATTNDTSDEVVASSLLLALGRPNNQFGILVGANDAEDYLPSFPVDSLDYGDGTGWAECRLRGKDDDALLVVTGWSLVRREGDGAWTVDGIEWQDFRDAYRPGIGREEWERICG